MIVSLMGRGIGGECPTYVIAEAGVNHNGSLDMAKKMVDAAKECGADAVKFQTFQPEKVVSEQAATAPYQRQADGREESQLEMLRRLALPFEAFRELFAYCQERGIGFLSTPFDEESADFLEEMGQRAFKIPSGEITNLPFLVHIARMKLPIVLSTGMSYLGEVDTAVRTIRDAGCEQLVLLHCVSNYPAEPEEVNLRAMRTMAAAFSVPVGYSDHTAGIEIALAAVAVGASMIEKHFTLDRALPGPDHKASLEPAELFAMIRSIRRVESAMGDGQKRPTPREAETAVAARKSLVAADHLLPGDVLTNDKIAVLRPGSGLAPAMRIYVLGRTAAVEIMKGEPIRLEMLR